MMSLAVFLHWVLVCDKHRRIADNRPSYLGQLLSRLRQSLARQRAI